MKKILLTLSFLALATPASADYYRHRHGGGNWVAPLVGGLIVGGIVGGAIASEPRYYAPPPAYRTECRIVPVYDRWGYYVGDRRECYNVPVY